MIEEANLNEIFNKNQLNFIYGKDRKERSDLVKLIYTKLNYKKIIIITDDLIYYNDISNTFYNEIPDLQNEEEGTLVVIDSIEFWKISVEIENQISEKSKLLNQNTIKCLEGNITLQELNNMNINDESILSNNLKNMQQNNCTYIICDDTLINYYPKALLFPNNVGFTTTLFLNPPDIFTALILHLNFNAIPEVFSIINANSPSKNNKIYVLYACHDYICNLENN